jgi:hypothetical protein
VRTVEQQLWRENKRKLATLDGLVAARELEQNRYTHGAERPGGAFTSPINMHRLWFGGALRRGPWKFRLRILTYR